MSDGHDRTAEPAQDPEPAPARPPPDAPPDAAAADATSDAIDDLEADLAAAAADLAAAEVTEDLQLARLAQRARRVPRRPPPSAGRLRELQEADEQAADRAGRAGRRAAGHKLLPVFDTADLAIAHGGGEEVKQIWTALFDALEREGLERIDPVGVAFDPTVHDAVAHEPGEGDGEPEVAEVMRAGYRWKGRVLRPAMVKVRG